MICHWGSRWRISVIMSINKRNGWFWLLQHYEQDADGLCTQLTKSLPKKGKQEFCVDTKKFIEAGWVIQEHELEVKWLNIYYSLLNRTISVINTSTVKKAVEYQKRDLEVLGFSFKEQKSR